MRDVEAIGRVSGLSRADAYGRLADFSVYGNYSSAVRSVTVSRDDDGRCYSQWEVSFREGILRWTEEDIFAPEDYTLRFVQITGDIDSFSGAWVVTDTDDGVQVRFSCSFDMGIPSLNDIIEPIAAQALRENALSIIAGLHVAVTSRAFDEAASGDAMCHS